MASSSIDIGDYKPCVMTPDEFRAALAIVIPAHLHKQVCDRHKDGDAEHKKIFEESLVNVSDMFKPAHTENAEMKKKLDDNPKAKRHFQHVRPYIVTQAHAIQGLRMASTPADNTDKMDLNEIFAAVGASSGEQRDRLATSALQRMDSLSQGLFGVSFQTINEATHNLETENWAIKRLLQTYAKEK
ncbi:Thioredoxin reductase [Lasiodiplodia theobromae]|uniref:Thioredoxin reductase n=1 Tax=Lasiodiplodia theobromae TaxID=45133 RepID=UPI0015C2CAF2|nr:Thioredoxin reductase [Lasiodiplodia theobromae]KAF4534952.1 Thioredoxin reductase [Lasiodiplodia theobromae]